MLNSVVTEVLEKAREHQEGRVTDDVTSVTNFTERWFRTIGDDASLYDLDGKRQQEFIEWFCEEDADDDEARLIALSENLERSDLTAVEEAKAFAEYVDVAVSKDDLEALEEAGVGVVEPDGERGQYTVDFANYTTHIKGADVEIDHISLPGENSQSVKSAANKIPGVTPDQIQNRLELLLLPDDLLDAVDNGTLQKSMS